MVSRTSSLRDYLLVVVVITMKVTDIQDFGRLMRQIYLDGQEATKSCCMTCVMGHSWDLTDITCLQPIGMS